MVNWLLSFGPELRNGLQAFCWMLIHSLWQGLLLGIVTGVVILFTGKAKAAIRYGIIHLLFFVFLAGCLYTFINEWAVNHRPASTATINTTSFTVAGILRNSSIGHFAGKVAGFCSANISLILMIWFAFLC